VLLDGDEFMPATESSCGSQAARQQFGPAEITSPHRTLPPPTRSLMGDRALVWWQNHVVCRDWGGDVLYRSDDKIMCRAMQSIEIDGQLHDGRGPCGWSYVLGTDFRCLEAV
jgi:hypothetical protein